jgi:hypothetical protein
MHRCSGKPFRTIIPRRRAKELTGGETEIAHKPISRPVATGQTFIGGRNATPCRAGAGNRGSLHVGHNNAAKGQPAC